MTWAAQEPHLRELARYAGRTRIALIGLGLLGYGVALYVWTLGQSLGAAVIAVFGYLVLRSRARLTYERTCRHFRKQPEISALLAAFDADTLTQGEAAMRRRLQRGEREEQS